MVDGLCNEQGLDLVGLRTAYLDERHGQAKSSTLLSDVLSSSPSSTSAYVLWLVATRLLCQQSAGLFVCLLFLRTSDHTPPPPPQLAGVSWCLRFVDPLLSPPGVRPLGQWTRHWLVEQTQAPFAPSLVARCPMRCFRAPIRCSRLSARCAGGSAAEPWWTPQQTTHAPRCNCPRTCRGVSCHVVSHRVELCQVNLASLCRAVPCRVVPCRVASLSSIVWPGVV